MVKLNITNLYELKNLYRTETAHYVYMAQPQGIGVYRLLRRRKKSLDQKLLECRRFIAGSSKNGGGRIETPRICT